MELDFESFIMYHVYKTTILQWAVQNNLDIFFGLQMEFAEIGFSNVLCMPHLLPFLNREIFWTCCSIYVRPFIFICWPS